MYENKLVLRLLDDTFSVCRLSPDAALPSWADGKELFAFIRTQDELSLVCKTGCVPQGIRAEHDFCAIKVKGPLDFSLTGILVSIAIPLADAGISIFTLSTYDTDYILIRQKKLAHVIEALKRAGHRLDGANWYHPA